MRSLKGCVVLDRIRASVKEVAKESLKSYYEGRYELDTKERKAMDLFGLDYDTDFDSVKQRYRELSRRYHPDNLESGDNDRFIAIRSAYDVLKSAFSKRKNDG